MTFLIQAFTSPHSMETVAIDRDYHTAVRIATSLITANLTDYAEIREDPGEGAPPSILWTSDGLKDPFADATDKATARARAMDWVGLMSVLEGHRPPALPAEEASPGTDHEEWRCCLSCSRQFLVEPNAGPDEPRHPTVGCCSQYCARERFTPLPLVRHVDLTDDQPIIEAQLAATISLDPRIPRGQSDYTPAQLNTLAGAVQQMLLQYLESVMEAPLPGGVVRGWSCSAVSLVAAPIPEP